MKRMHHLSLRGIEKVMEVMGGRFDWFGELPKDRQFELAIELLTAQKTSIQKYRFLLDIIPWIIAGIALFRH
jgi:hypothetical protein